MDPLKKTFLKSKKLKFLADADAKAFTCINIYVMKQEKPEVNDFKRKKFGSKGKYSENF